jgi:hypothetical protein
VRTGGSRNNWIYSWEKELFPIQLRKFNLQTEMDKTLDKKKQ